MEEGILGLYTIFGAEPEIQFRAGLTSRAIDRNGNSVASLADVSISHSQFLSVSLNATESNTIAGYALSHGHAHLTH
jgi:hypothetical protein